MIHAGFCTAPSILPREVAWTSSPCSTCGLRCTARALRGRRAFFGCSMEQALEGEGGHGAVRQRPEHRSATVWDTGWGAGRGGYKSDAAAVGVGMIRWSQRPGLRVSEAHGFVAVAANSSVALSKPCSDLLSAGTPRPQMPRVQIMTRGELPRACYRSGPPPLRVLSTSDTTFRSCRPLPCSVSQSFDLLGVKTVKSIIGRVVSHVSATILLSRRGCEHRTSRSATGGLVSFTSGSRLCLLAG